jgi:hypothetical protein
VEHFLKLHSARICNLPGVDVTRVACLAELQAFDAVAAAGCDALYAPLPRVSRISNYVCGYFSLALPSITLKASNK